MSHSLPLLFQVATRFAENHSAGQWDPEFISSRITSHVRVLDFKLVRKRVEWNSSSCLKQDREGETSEHATNNVDIDLSLNSFRPNFG